MKDEGIDFKDGADIINAIYQKTKSNCAKSGIKTMIDKLHGSPWQDCDAWSKQLNLKEQAFVRLSC